MNFSNHDATGNSTACSDESRRTSVAALFFTLSAFAFSGNMFIIVLAAKYTVRKNLHHLIINMAAMDICVMITFPFYLVPNLFDFRPLSVGNMPETIRDEVCRLSGFPMLFFPGASLVTLLIISIQRFRATRLTAQRTLPYTLKRRLLEIACTYAVSTVTSSFAILGAEYTNNKGCALVSGTSASLYLSTFALFFLICFLLITFLNVAVKRRLSKEHPIEAQISEAQRQARADRIRKVVKMVDFSMIVFCLCYSPQVIFSTGSSIVLTATENKVINVSFDDFCSNSQLVYAVVLIFLPILNACVSPFIYIAFLKDFQEATKRILRRMGNRINKRGSVDLQQDQENGTV